MQKSKDKIIVVEGGPSVLLANPEILLNGNVIQVSPLPTSSDIETVVEQSKCRECGNKALRLITYEKSEKVGGAMARCKKCQSLTWIFLSEERLWSADLIIAIGSSKSGAHREQLKDLKCVKCGSIMEAKFKRPDNEYDFLMVLPMLMVCTNKTCDCRMNTIFWDTPKSYFQLALKLAEEVIPHSSRAALVFIVSALETYLQKAFMFQSPTNKFLVQKRKINFQSLQDANDVYKQFMGLDLTQILDNKEWEIISSSITKRHGLIHNSGLDKHFEEICVDEEEIEPLKDMVVRFVNSINGKLEDAGTI